MEWFGWLTKGKCAISLLDILIMFTEFAASTLVIFLIMKIAEKNK